MFVPLSVVPSVVVRWFHVVAAASVFGGAGLAWWVLREAARTGGPDRTVVALSTARAYERGFWAAVGVIVATGVGNLGALSPAVRGPDTAWGTTLSFKLALVVVLLVGSVVRTVLVAEFSSVRTAESVSERTTGTAPERHVNSRRLVVVRSAYAVTAIWLLAIVGFAEVLAHG